MEHHDASAQRQRDDTTDRLTEAAGATDQPTREALAEVARACGSHTVDTLVALLRRVRTVAPDRVSACPMVAFVGYGRAEGVPAVRGAAVSADGTGRYNVHTVFWDDSTARWEAQNGRYGVTWAVALGELVGRAETAVQP